MASKAHSPQRPGGPVLRSLTIANIVALGVIMLAVTLLAAVFKTPGGWIIDDRGRPTERDFVNFYSAGQLVLQGRPAAAYDRAMHMEAQTNLVGDHRKEFFPWPYPPIALPPASGLAALPYGLSFSLFAAASLALFAAAAGLICGRPDGALWATASAAALFNIVVGQNGLLSAALIGTGLYLLPSRPVVAGVAFGLLAYKPHLGVLLPLFLVILGRWQAFASASATVLVTAAATLWLYGPEPWIAFAQGLAGTGSSFAAGDHIISYKLQSMFGLLRTLDVAAAPAMAAHLATAAMAATVAMLFWASKAPYALKASALCVAATMMSPYIFIYDLTLLVMAQAFLIRHAFERGGISGPLGVALAATQLFTLAFLASSLPLGLLASLATGAGIAWEARASRPIHGLSRRVV